jgi:glutamate carboxypeptidase
MGDGAIFEASRILGEIHRTMRAEKYLTVNPGLFVGGIEALAPDHNATASGKTNVVAAKAIVRGDIRFISPEQKEAAMKQMREIAGRSLNGTSATIRFDNEIPAMAPTDANYSLLRILDQASRDLGFEEIRALDPGDRGAGDISYLTHLIPGLDGLGAAGGGSHAAGEYVDLETLPKQIKRASVMIYRLLQ